MVFIEYIPWSTLGKNCPASCAASLSFHSEIYLPSPASLSFYAEIECLWFFLYRSCPSKARAGVASSTKAFPEPTDCVGLCTMCCATHGRRQSCSLMMLNKGAPIGFVTPHSFFSLSPWRVAGALSGSWVVYTGCHVWLQTWGPEKRCHWFSIKSDACKFKKNEDRNKRRGEKIFIWTSLTFNPYFLLFLSLPLLPLLRPLLPWLFIEILLQMRVCAGWVLGI